jgi:hypothetical protein
MKRERGEIYLKKGSLIFLILILILGIFVGGNLYLNMKKPTNFYYTNLLAKNLTLCSNYEVKLLDTNFYKTESITLENVDIVKSFLKELRKSNFIPKPVTISNKPKYKIFFTFFDTGEKYVINIYDDQYASIYPWDGSFSMDYINMKDIPLRYNLYSLGKNVFVKEVELK